MKSILDRIFGVLAIIAIVVVVFMIGYSLIATAFDMIDRYRDIVILVLAVLLLRTDQKIEKMQRQLDFLSQDRQGSVERT